MSLINKLFCLLCVNGLIKISLQLGNLEIEIAKPKRNKQNKAFNNVLNEFESSSEKSIVNEISDSSDSSGVSSDIGEGEEPPPSKENSTIEVSNQIYKALINTEESYVNSNSTTPIGHTYSVSVQRKGSHYASGALVGVRWVLTSAAEFYNVGEIVRIFRLRLGSIDCKRGGVLIPLMSIEIHPLYAPGKPGYDVAMLRLAKPVPCGGVAIPIKLSNVEAKVVSAVFLTTYWPKIVRHDKILPRSAKEREKQSYMRISEQRLVPTDQCVEQMRAVNETMDGSMLCLQPVKIHHSNCTPDPGAPVAAEDGLWGITSAWVSPKCYSEPSTPTLATRIALPEIRNWIITHLLSL